MLPKPITVGGKKFSSLREAARALKMPESSVRAHLRKHGDLERLIRRRPKGWGWV